MRRGRGAGLAGLAAVLLAAVGRAQVQQEPSAETTEGIAITINCSHPSIQLGDSIYWYRQLPGRGPAFLMLVNKGSKELSDPPGKLWVSSDRRSSSLLLSRPRRRDAAVYYCAVGDTGRGAGAAAGHEPPRAGPGVCVGVGGTAPAGPARGRCCSCLARSPLPGQPETGRARPGGSRMCPTGLSCFPTKGSEPSG